MVDTNNTDGGRRGYLKKLGAVGIPALVAGCLQDDDVDDDTGEAAADDPEEAADDEGTDEGAGDDETGENSDAEREITISTAPEPTANFAATQGVGTLVNENTDEIFVDVRPSEGFVVNMGKLDRGEVDAALYSNTLAVDIVDGKEPLDELDFELGQIMHMATTEWLFVTADEDIQTWADMDGATIAPGPPGTATAELMQYALDVLELDYQEDPTGFGDMGSAIAEGRIDVGLSASMNSAFDPVEPGFIETIKAAADIHVVGISDENAEVLNSDPRVDVLDFDPGPIADGYTDVPDPVRGIVLASFVGAPVSFSYDNVYTLLETAWEHREELAEYHDLLTVHQNDDHWMNFAYEEVPFHDAAADFYEEVGIWDDTYDRAGHH